MLKFSSGEFKSDFVKGIKFINYYYDYYYCENASGKSNSRFGGRGFVQCFNSGKQPVIVQCKLTLSKISFNRSYITGTLRLVFEDVHVL